MYLKAALASIRVQPLGKSSCWWSTFLRSACQWDKILRRLQFEGSRPVDHSVIGLVSQKCFSYKLHRVTCATSRSSKEKPPCQAVQDHEGISEAAAIAFVYMPFPMAFPLNSRLNRRHVAANQGQCRKIFQEVRTRSHLRSHDSRLLVVQIWRAMHLQDR
jgi:hypothetical protein